MMNNMKYILALSSCLIFLSCSRTSEKTPLVDAQVNLGPAQKDVDLDLRSLSIEERKNYLKTNGEFATKDFFQFSENLLSLSRQKNSREIEMFSRGLIQNYRDLPIQKSTFADSLYTQTILGEGEPEVRKQLKIISKEIQRAILGLSNLLDKSGKNYPWPQNLNNFAEALSVTDAYATWMVNEIPKLGLDREITRPIQSAIKGEYSRFRPIVAGHMENVQSAPTLSRSLVALSAAMTEFQIKLAGADLAEFKKAQKLATSIDAVESSQDALTLIIDVWRMSSPADRERIFKAKIPDLYDFLKDKDESSLDCLASSFCINPVLGLAKRVAILPKISEYGVEKVQDEVDSAARQELMKSVLKAVAGFIPTLPGYVKDQMLVEVEKYKKQIADIEKDFSGFAKTRIKKWSDTNFKTAVRGYEPLQINLKLPNAKDLEIGLLNLNSKQIESGAEVMGSSLAIAHEFLPPKTGAKFALRAALVEPIIKMLSITGFRKVGGAIYPSLMLPLDGEREQLFNISNLLQGTTSFAVPNRFIANPQTMIMNRKTAPKDSSVSSQAELLRGFSKQIKFHRDWEHNTFDEVLGSIKIDEVIPEAPRGAIDYSLFPKDVVFTLAVGGAGGILQNIIRNLSPAFLILDKNEILWGNDYLKISEGKISTVAAMVNIENGKRGEQIRTADIAKFIIAVDEFLEATDGIEKTKSPVLNAVDENGKSILEQVSEARRYLRLFQMGLTNFLVYYAQNKDGSFSSSFHLGKSLARESNLIYLQDQVLAIQALNRTSKRLNLPLFRWAALDGFYFLNKKMWDAKSQFYTKSYSEKTGGMGNLNSMDLVQALQGLEESSEILPGPSKQQWNKVINPWITALERF
jgi:hypothetical protein